MTPAATQAPTSQITLIPLSQLRDPDWNPRPFFDEAEMQSLVDFMASGGHIPPIEVLKKAADQGDAPWDVISGKRRCEAARRLGWTQIEAIERDITLEEARFQAIAANRDNKPYWLGEYLAVEKVVLTNPKIEQTELVKRTSWPKWRVSCALAVIKLLDEASRQLILESAKKTVLNENNQEDEITTESSEKAKWVFSENIARQLAILWDEDNNMKSRELAGKAVRMVLDRQLTGAPTRALVAHLQSGGEAEAFQPAAKVKRTRGPKGATPTPPKAEPEASNKAVDIPAQIPRPFKPESPAPAGEVEKGDTRFWQFLAGIPLLAPIKAKLKKGQRPNFVEALILTVAFLWRGLVWVVKPALKVLKGVAKGIWHLVKSSLGSLFHVLGRGVYQVAKVVLAVAFFIGLVWLGWDIYRNGVWHPVRLLESKISSPFTAHRSQPTKAEATAKPEVAQLAQETQKPEIATSPSGPSGPAPRNDSDHSNVGKEPPAKQVQAPALPPAEPAQVSAPPLPSQAQQSVPKAQAQKPAQGDVLSQAGDAVGKAAGGVDVAKKLFGF